MPDQAWLRIAMLSTLPTAKQKAIPPFAQPIVHMPRFQFRFPAIHPVRSRKLPFGATLFIDESPALPLS
jgi:hypothetical protein